MRVKLKDIGKIVTGKTPSKREASYWDSDDIPFVKPDDFKNDVSILTNYNSYVSTSGSEKGNKVPANSVLVTCIGTIGKVVVTEKEVITNQQINAIIPNEKIDSKYLMYQILKKREYLNHIANAPVVPIVNKSTFEKVEIFLLPLTEQKNIAKTLDKAKELIELRKASIEKLDELSKSVFIDMFGDPVENPMGWEVMPCIQKAKCIVPGRDKPKSFSGEIKWVTTNDLSDRRFLITNKITIGLTEDEISNVKAKLIPKGSVIFTCVGNLGVVSIIDDSVIMNQQLHSFQCDDDLNNIFLMFNISYQKSYMYKYASQTTVPYMNKTICNNIPLIYPPLNLQNKFAKTIQKIESQKALYEKELVKLEENFEALLAKSFG